MKRGETPSRIPTPSERPHEPAARRTMRQHWQQLTGPGNVTAKHSYNGLIGSQNRKETTNERSQRSVRRHRRSAFSMLDRWSADPDVPAGYAEGRHGSKAQICGSAELENGGGR